MAEDAQISAKKDYIVSWLRDKRDSAGSKGGILGVSGGIDSALVLALAKEAYGSHVMGLVIPIGSDPKDVEDALLVLRKFQTEFKIVELDEVYERFLVSLGPEGSELLKANIKPRLRMTALYYYGGLKHYLVLGTGNKVEIHVGYYTKHGDGGADLWPIADLTKDEVRRMSRIMGVPEEIVKKAPSGGLWPGQTDEKEIGVSYKELDAFLEGSDISPESAARIEALHKSTEHKRHMPPFPKFQK